MHQTWTNQNKYCTNWHINNNKLGYRIAGNFRGVKYSWFSWLEVWPRIFYPRMKRPCLPLPAVQAATTKILPTKSLNNLLLNHKYFVSRKLPAIRYINFFILILFERKHNMARGISTAQLVTLVIKANVTK